MGMQEGHHAPTRRGVNPLLKFRLNHDRPFFAR